jgi:hypothetical protein
MVIIVMAFCLAGLLVGLGFIALLKQKTYLDPNSQQPITIEVPVVGKMQTNFPALVFVFLGFALAFATFHKGFPPRKIEWQVNGSFVHPQKKKFLWSNGTIALVPAPAETHVIITDQGRFEITAQIEEGKSFEDIYETLDYSHPEGSVHIDLKQEVAALSGKQVSLVASRSDHTRTFKPVEITPLSPIDE